MDTLCSHTTIIFRDRVAVPRLYYPALHTRYLFFSSVLSRSSQVSRGSSLLYPYRKPMMEHVQAKIELFTETHSYIYFYIRTIYIKLDLSRWPVDCIWEENKMPYNIAVLEK